MPVKVTKENHIWKLTISASVSKDLVNVEIMMPDATIVKGLAEALVKDLNVDDIIQFERFGFYRLDKKEKDKEAKQQYKQAERKTEETELSPTL